MRKDSKRRQNVNMVYVQGYHSNNCSYGDNQGYAFQGFPETLYFNSDRAIRTRVENGVLVRVDNAPLAGYGTETEVECNSISNTSVLAEVFDKVIFPNFKFGKKMFKMQEDGSLGGDTSVEVISQVMTKGRIRNDYAAYHTMYDKYFQCLGLSSDARYTNCGMHINISNGVFGNTEADIVEGIRKFYYVINRHYRFMCRLFYRPADKTYWCGQMTEEHLSHQYWDDALARHYRYENARNIDLKGDVPTSHNNCVNLSHYKAGRIELRLPGGQDSYIRFRNTMECAFFLTENIRKVEWDDLDDLVKVFSGCNNYVVKRLRDCIGIGGYTPEMHHEIEANCEVVDLELR